MLMCRVRLMVTVRRLMLRLGSGSRWLVRVRLGLQARLVQLALPALPALRVPRVRLGRRGLPGPLVQLVRRGRPEPPAPPEFKAPLDQLGRPVRLVQPVPRALLARQEPKARQDPSERQDPLAPRVPPAQRARRDRQDPQGQLA